MSKWSDGLNKEQLEAANTLEGPVLILAGAGSGKTKTMTSRICHMIEDGISPRHILAITFTNKAAKEMKERLQKMLGKEDEEGMPTVSTFHSFGYRLLRQYGSRLGYRKNLGICTDDATGKDSDQTKILKKLVEEHIYREELDLAPSDAHRKSIKEHIKDDAKVYKSYISKCKDRLIKPEDDIDSIRGLLSMVSERELEKFILIYKKYEEYLMRDNLVDFDDLIEKSVFLLQIPEIRGHINGIYTYINVDEYQDTSRSQFELVKLLAGDNNNVCVVGDDYQSIYAFRGAVIENILNFPEHFSGCKKIILRANYRSTSNIVDGAAAVINNNNGQFHKDLYAYRGDGAKIALFTAENAREEGNYIASSIEKLVQGGEKYSDIAILYRKNMESRVIEDALLRKRIPYIIFGGTGYYERKEVKDILAYLKLTAGYNDVIALERVANFPTRGIGKKTLEETIKRVDNRDSDKSVLDAVKDVVSSQPKMSAFCEVIRKLKEANSKLALVEFVKESLEITGLKEYYEKQLETAKRSTDEEKIQTAVDKLQNLSEIITKATEFIDNYVPDPAEPDKTVLEAFLEEISLYTDSDKRGPENAVSLMTVHKSKGLEFKSVFLAAQDERDQIDYYDTEDIYTPEEEKNGFQIEEERRLFYVGMTRAKDNLSISCALEKMIYGDYVYTRPVRYIDEIPHIYINHVS